VAAVAAVAELSMSFDAAKSALVHAEERAQLNVLLAPRLLLVRRRQRRGATTARIRCLGSLLGLQ
jgi:hypothetical protein